jgi:hypothetical protein
MKLGPPITVLLSALLAGCSRPIRNGGIIDHYRAAECVPVKLGSEIYSPTREWDYTLKTREGESVYVSGAQVPGGQIDVRFSSDGKEAVAANAGDYIYPADVRFDRASQRLYVKASGSPAVFGGPETWLFEYDLRQRRQIGRALIDPLVLPQECPGTR